jgi:hypothetical protein
MVGARGALFAYGLSDARCAVQEKGAKWIAGENDVSRLTPELRRGKIGHNSMHVTHANIMPAPGGDQAFNGLRRLVESYETNPCIQQRYANWQGSKPSR